MSSPGTEQENKRPFFKDLIDRRVLQIMGIYIGVGWGIIQFVDWLANRYMLSPHLIDLTLVILISLLPSTLIIAYFHGSPGRDKWVKFERIGIPLNIVLTLFLVFFFFSGKDLGAVSKTVTVQDETGKQLERVIPKSGFRKKIALFDFKNETGDPSLDWMQYGISQMLEFDLSQDSFFEISTPHKPLLEMFDFYVYEKIKKAGYEKATGLPFALQKKIAEEIHTNYFLSGKLSMENGEYILESFLYQTRNAKLAAKSTLREKDIFKIVDDLSVRLKRDLEIPKGHIDEVSDLPIAEMFTRSLPVARLYSLGQDAMVFERNWAKALKYFEEAVKEDPAFAVGYSALASLYLLTNQGQKAAETIQSLMEHSYKLPERMQLFVKIGYYGNVKQDTEKQMAILKMIVDLYPDDLMAYSILAYFLSAQDRFDEAADAYRRMLEIDPERYEIYRKLGELYEKKGEFDRAFDYYKKFTEHFPTDPGAFIVIGKLARQQGNLEQAKEYNEKAQILEPENIPVLIELAAIQADAGDFDRAFIQLEEALGMAKTPKDRFDVYEELASFCERGGKMKKALEYRERMMDAAGQFMAPFYLSIYKIMGVDTYIRAGEEEEAFRVLASLEKEMKPPYDQFVSLGYLTVYLEMNKLEEAEKKFPEVEKFIASVGGDAIRAFLLKVRGKIHEMRGEYAAALQNYGELIKINPSKTGIFLDMGRCYRELKEYEKAEEYLQKVLKKNPFDPRSHYQLALLYMDAGNKEKAAEHLNIAVNVWKDADPGYKPALAAKEKLALL